MFESWGEESRRYGQTRKTTSTKLRATLYLSKGCLSIFKGRKYVGLSRSSFIPKSMYMSRLAKCVTLKNPQNLKNPKISRAKSECGSSRNTPLPKRIKADTKSAIKLLFPYPVLPEITLWQKR